MAEKMQLLKEMQLQKEKEMLIATQMERQQLRYDQKKAQRGIEDVGQMHRIVKVAKEVIQEQDVGGTGGGIQITQNHDTTHG